MDIGIAWRCVLVSCTQSQSIWLYLGVRCWLSIGVPFTNSLIGLYCIAMIVIIIGIFMAILFNLNYTFRLSVIKYFFFCKRAPPWMHHFAARMEIGRLILGVRTSSCELTYRGHQDISSYNGYQVDMTYSKNYKMSYTSISKTKHSQLKRFIPCEPKIIKFACCNILDNGDFPIKVFVKTQIKINNQLCTTRKFLAI